MKPTFRLVGLIVGAAALVALGVTITFVTFRRIENGAAAEQHARAVLSQAADLLSKLKDVESSMRGYVITGDTSYLEPYNSVKGQVVSDSGTPIPAHLTLIHLVRGKGADTVGKAALASDGRFRFVPEIIR